MSRWGRFGLVDKPAAHARGAERFVAEMRSHVAAGGDPNPGATFKAASGYSLGALLSQHRNGLASYTLSEEQWAELVALGVRREQQTAAQRFVTELEAWVAAGGDPNPDGNVVTVDGYRLGAALGRARSDHMASMTEELWRRPVRLGTRRRADTPGER